jgi:serine protease Do
LKDHEEGIAMRKRYGIIMVALLPLSFVAGIYLAPSLGLSSEKTVQDRPKETILPAVNSQAREIMGQISRAFEDASAKVSPAIVSIFAEQTVAAQQGPYGMPDDSFKDFFGEDFFKRFFGTPPQQEQKQTVRSLGSGVIVTPDGYILTNNHVVEKAQKLSVVIGDKKTYPAKVIGADPPSDIAVIKIDAQGLPVAVLGNSDDAKVGEWVIAVGNPFQLMHTVTAGIISAQGRSSVGLADYEDFIQTDASINPGNSGGALADLDGEVIGINTAIASSSGGSVGIGFAIPINMAKQVMDELIAKGKVTRGYLGLTPQDINEDLAKALHIKQTEGVLVGDVAAGGPADRAGIKRGDVITEFNGQKIENSVQLRKLAAQAEPKTLVAIGVIRENRKMDIRLTLAERPKDGREQAPLQEQPEERASRNLGLRLQDLTPEIADQLGYKGEQGVVVADVASGSPAEDAGLQRGDLIEEVNRIRVRSMNEFEKSVRGLKSGDAVALTVRRGPNTFFLALKIQ